MHITVFTASPNSNHAVSRDPFSGRLAHRLLRWTGPTRRTAYVAWTWEQSCLYRQIDSPDRATSEKVPGAIIVQLCVRITPSSGRGTSDDRTDNRVDSL